MLRGAGVPGASVLCSVFFSCLPHSCLLHSCSVLGTVPGSLCMQFISLILHTLQGAGCHRPVLGGTQGLGGWTACSFSWWGLWGASTLEIPASKPVPFLQATYLLSFPFSKVLGQKASWGPFENSPKKLLDSWSRYREGLCFHGEEPPASR